MNNKTIIVTGASGNMGQAVVRQFLMKGYNVVGTIAPHDPVPFEIKHPQLEKPVVNLASEEASEQLYSGSFQNTEPSMRPCSPLADLPWEILPTPAPRMYCTSTG